MSNIRHCENPAENTDDLKKLTSKPKKKLTIIKVLHLLKLIINYNLLFLSDCNGTRTHNYLVRKRKLKNLAKIASLAKWLIVRLRTKWLWV